MSQSLNKFLSHAAGLGCQARRRRSRTFSFYIFFALRSNPMFLCSFVLGLDRGNKKCKRKWVREFLSMGHFINKELCVGTYWPMDWNITYVFLFPFIRHTQFRDVVCSADEWEKENPSTSLSFYITGPLISSYLPIFFVTKWPSKYKKRKRKWKATGGVPHILAAQ